MSTEAVTDMAIVEVMNFLNEVANDYPNAISLASGRPNPQFYDRSAWPGYQQRFIEHCAARQGLSQAKVETRLCEYGPAAGIINDIIARYLAKDEGFEVTPEQIIVTNGFQEAVSLLCLNLLQDDNDCIVTIDPSYIGVSALLLSLGKKVVGVDVNQLSRVDNGQRFFDFALLHQQIEDLAAQGLNPKAIYVNPDFNNPMAYHLSEQERLDLLDCCAGLKLPIIEDSPYARFSYAGAQPQQSLAALDRFGLVYHIGSFSKTFCPGVRVGFVVVPPQDKDAYQKLVALKSLISVNTAAVTQSIVGGFLLANDFSLTHYLEPVVAQYGAQCQALQQALSQHLGDINGVSWQAPAGGFFALVDLPFDFTKDDVFSCAQHNGVICMPVSFFSLSNSKFKRQLRLSFSYYSGEKINQGVSRLADFIRQKRSVAGHKTDAASGEQQQCPD